jgi:hypothetical protein
VFISYGAQSNDSLLLLYGFVEPGNPHDTHAMAPGALMRWLSQLEPVPPGRLQALAAAGFAGALDDVVVTRQGVGAQTLQALRYLLLPAAGGGPARLPALSPGACASAADAATEQRLALALVHACQQEAAVLDGGSSSSSSASGGEGATTTAPPGSSKKGGGSSSSSRKARSGSRKARSGSGSGGGGSSSGSASGGAGVSDAAASALAAAFRREKKNVLMACIQQLTGERSS